MDVYDRMVGTIVHKRYCNNGARYTLKETFGELVLLVDSNGEETISTKSDIIIMFDEDENLLTEEEMLAASREIWLKEQKEKEDYEDYLSLRYELYGGSSGYWD